MGIFDKIKGIFSPDTKKSIESFDKKIDKADPKFPDKNPQSVDDESQLESQLIKNKEIVESKSDSTPYIDSEPELVPTSDIDPEPESDSTPDIDLEPELVPTSDIDPEPESDSTPDIDPEPELVPTSDIDPESESDSTPDIEPEPESVPTYDIKPEPESVPKSDTGREKLDKTLNKTREGFFGKMKLFFSGKNTIDEHFLDHLEEMLIMADVGVTTTVKIIDLIEVYVSKHKYLDKNELKDILKQEIVKLLNNSISSNDQSVQLPKPYVILFVGVNGVGKTTTIAKLAHSLKKDGKRIIIGAADTFRAAAIEQLESWAKRIDVPIVRQDMGADPASVAYDTVQSGVSSNMDYILIDTAGRLHNKVNLMMELEKINKAIDKVLPNAPHEVVLVLDASTGQNALEQAKQFLKSTDVNYLALTKLDGTAKGGVVISICDQLNIPIKYIGVGEGIDDIQLFDKMSFVESLFK